MAAGHSPTIKNIVSQALSANQEPPLRRMECEAGAEAQIDFGQAAPVVGADEKRRPYVLRVMLSHSCKGNSEAVDRQTTENFTRYLENGFVAFSGGRDSRLLLGTLSPRHRRLSLRLNHFRKSL